MKKFEFFLLFLILAGAFLVRLYKFQAPIADFHSWRQADTSAVSRNFVKDGFDILHPRFDDLSRVQSRNFENPKGYRFVEFPIYNALQAESFLLFNKLTLEEWGRIVSIISSLISIVFLYLIVKRHAKREIALFSVLFFAFLPFNIFWGRTVLPDSSTVAATLGGIFFFDLWVSSRKMIHFVFTFIFLSLALLLKPLAVFFFLPLIWTAFEKWGIGIFKNKSLYILSFLSLLPFILWRLWELKFPEGVPQSAWLFNEGDIRFTGAYFRWIFQERIGLAILGSWGLVLLMLGIIFRKRNYFYSFLLSTLFYLIIVARGNVQHSYYQIPIIPTIAVFLGFGANFLLNPPREFSRILTVPVLLITILFMFAFSWYEVRNYYNIQDQAIITAGEAVDKLTPKDAKIIAPQNGDTTILYFAKRKGWPVWEKPLPSMIKMGADYLLIIHPKESDKDFEKNYKIVEKTNDFILFNLHPEGAF